MPPGVQVNLTINSLEGIKIPIVTTTLSSFSYQNITNITFAAALPTGQKIGLVYSAQLDIYTFGQVLTTLIPKFSLQKSNLQACYEPRSVAQVFRNRIEVELFPTGLCKTQMQLKAASPDNFLQAVQLSLSGALVELDLNMGFDYMVAKQEIMFKDDLLEFVQQQPFLNAFIVFTTSQVGSKVEFQVDVESTRLETVVAFFQVTLMSLQNDDIYLRLQFDQDKYDDYEKVLGDHTTFKLSFIVNGTQHSFLSSHNAPLVNNQVLQITCASQIIKLRPICSAIVLSQQFDRVVLDIISVGPDQTLKSMYKQMPQMVPTCWTKVTAVRRKNVIDLTLYLNGKCSAGPAEFSLINHNAAAITASSDSSATQVSFTGYDGFFDTARYGLSMVLDGATYLLFLDDVKAQPVNYGTIAAVAVGASWVACCTAFAIYGIVQAVVAMKNRKRTSRRKAH
uniref:Transmembrane protein n=1 Tax=Spironucleus salmonicida TaxID=348837 RepID=V6LDG3_9EUKA|eukprot:EST42522.1 Hypothetical protein SS50377_17834 [Spironucleus salmonicida]